MSPSCFWSGKTRSFASEFSWPLTLFLYLRFSAFHFSLASVSILLSSTPSTLALWLRFNRWYSLRSLRTCLFIKVSSRVHHFALFFTDVWTQVVYWEISSHPFSVLIMSPNGRLLNCSGEQAHLLILNCSQSITILKFSNLDYSEETSNECGIRSICMRCDRWFPCLHVFPTWKRSHDLISTQLASHQYHLSP